MRHLYAIRDVVMGALIGTLMQFRAEAAAVREFAEACGNPEALGRRAGDYELVCVGTITDEGVVVGFPEPVVVLTGAAWLAARTPQGPQLELQA